MKWLAFKHNEQVYDLSHLNSFYWTHTTKQSKNRPKREFRFQTSFSMHCFTRDPLRGEKYCGSLIYEVKKEKRLFCFDRYSLSYQLPEIIQSMGDRACWHTHKGNFFTIELVDNEGKQIEYEVYFDVTKASRKGWLNLIVQSAYVRTDEYKINQPRKRKISLDVIAYNKYMKKSIKPSK